MTSALAGFVAASAIASVGVLLAAQAGYGLGFLAALTAAMTLGGVGIHVAEVALRV